MISATIALGKRAFGIFSKERAASRGAAIAFYTVTSIAPILVIVVAVAGLVFGNDAASGAIYQQFSGLLGAEGADILQKAIASASSKAAGITATIISVVTLLLGASGVFLELEDGLNAIWQAKAPEGLAGMARARIASLGLVIALGFLLIVSLVIDAGLEALSSFLPFSASVMLGLSIAVSVAMLTMLFAAIFKFLPATPVAWENVKFGAVITALLFEAGKFLIGTYLGSNGAISSLGAAGALLALLFWVYYSSQIFLFGAALTKARAEAGESREEDAQCGFLPGTPMLDSSLRKEDDAPSLVSVIVLVLVSAVAFRILERLDPKEH